MPVKKLKEDARAFLQEELRVGPGLYIWDCFPEWGRTWEEHQKAFRVQIEAFLADAAVWDHSGRAPVPMTLKRLDLDYEGRVWLYGNRIFGVKGEYTEEQEKLLVMDAFDSERRMFERLANRFAKGVESRADRPRIPEDVRIAVWRRDQGKCAKCGSRERLEYDHIVPLSAGGSNTLRNIELLCEKCNREKGASVR